MDLLVRDKNVDAKACVSIMHAGNAAAEAVWQTKVPGDLLMTGRLAKAALCVLLMLSAQAHAADRVRAPFIPDSGSIALRCGVLIDGISDGARLDQVVVIREGRITSMEPGSARTAKSLQAIDLSA